MTFRFGLLSVALSIPALLAAPDAHAQGAIDISWDAPSECPQESAVRERLDALLGKGTQSRRHLYADGRIEHVGKRYRLTLSVRERDAVRERTMNADSCDDLTGAAAVALGLLIRNEHGAVGEEDSASGTGTPAGQGSESGSSSEVAGVRNVNGARGSDASKTAPVGPAPSKKSSSGNETAKRDDSEDESASASTTSSEPRRWRVLVRGPSAALALGRLPKPSGGVAASLGASYDDWRLSLTARVLGTQTIRTNSAYEAGARVGHRDLELGLCRDWRDGRFALAPCATVQVERETARGRGVGVTPRPRSLVSAVFAGGLEARLFAFDWLALAATAAFGVETSSPQLQVTTAGDVKKLGPVELSLSVGPELIF